MKSRTFTSSTAVLSGSVLVALLVACNGESEGNEESRPAATSSPTASPVPVVTPSTAAQENALVQEIQLDGNSLRPLFWKLPDSIEPGHEAALLAARRAAAVVALAFTDEQPARWLSTMLSTEKIRSTDGFYRYVARAGKISWEKREVGPAWYWVQEIREISPTIIEIALCDDQGWTTTIGNPQTSRDTGGGVTTVTVSLLDDYPDGKRWKVTNQDVYKTSDTKKYSAQCKEWKATHTTTGSWTRPPKVEPTDGSAP
jgi:hypothetical protein